MREINKLREKMIHSHEVQTDIIKELETINKNKLDLSDFNTFIEAN